MKINASMLTSTQLLAKLLTFLLFLLSIISLSLALPTNEEILNNKIYRHVIKTRSTSQRYCGNHIVKILSFLCDGNYFSPTKRDPKLQQNSLNNGISSFWDDMTPNAEYTKPDESSSDYFLEPKTAFNIFGNRASNTGDDSFTRNRRGIVDECCRKSCSIKELYSYCE